MYGIYANIGGILMVDVTIYSIHGSYGYRLVYDTTPFPVNVQSYIQPISSPFTAMLRKSSPSLPSLEKNPQLSIPYDVNQSKTAFKDLGISKKNIEVVLLTTNNG